MPHYFDDPAAPSSPRTVVVDVPGARFEMDTDRGVFSHGRLDPGTSVLLRTVPSPPSVGRGLDLGCGTGAIALTMAIRAPALSITAVDVNERARALCSSNAERLGLSNIDVAAPPEIPADRRYDVIWSNPPVRIGKPALHDLTSSWLSRVASGGSAFFVMHKNLGADSFHNWLIGEGHHVERINSSRGYRVLHIAM